MKAKSGIVNLNYPYQHPRGSDSVWNYFKLSTQGEQGINLYPDYMCSVFSVRYFLN